MFYINEFVSYLVSCVNRTIKNVFSYTILGTYELEIDDAFNLYHGVSIPVFDGAKFSDIL